MSSANPFTSSTKAAKAATSASSARSGFLTPEIVAHEIVGRMTNSNRYGTKNNPIEYYMQVNKLDSHPESTIASASSSMTSLTAAAIRRSPSPHRTRVKSPVVDEEREERIGYTLDMIVHHLIKQGQLNPARSYTLNTPKMRAHVGRMLDQIREKRSATVGVRSSSTGRESTINASNIAQSSRGVRFATELKKKAAAKLRSPIAAYVETAKINSTYTAPGSSSRMKKKIANLTSANARPSFSTSGSSRSKTGGGLMKPGISIAASSNNETNTSSDSRNFSSSTRVGSSFPRVPASAISYTATQLMDEVNLLAPERLAKYPDYIASKQLARAPVEAYRIKVDLAGFTDEHISLDLKGRRLTVEAYRPADSSKGIQSRRVKEIIEIPLGIHYENLDIGRRSDGSLWIEENVPQPAGLNVYENFTRFPFPTAQKELDSLSL